MAKVSLSEHMKEDRLEPVEPEQIGPFVTISRQFGCYGFSLGLLLLDILTEETPENPWKIYHKEILSRLASETEMAEELLERQRRTKPRLILDFFRSFGGERPPSGYEIRNRITSIIRALAAEGHAIILGQGGAAATYDLPNGLSIRLEAPEEWRVKQVAFREGISETEAKIRMKAKEQEREYLRKVYEQRFPHKPAFHLTYDCSVFSLAQIARQVAYAAKLRGCV